MSCLRLIRGVKKMTDENCTKWVLPAISAGYAVVNDSEGKLKFWNDRYVITHRDGSWCRYDVNICCKFKYATLQEALEADV